MHALLQLGQTQDANRLLQKAKKEILDPDLYEKLLNLFKIENSKTLSSEPSAAELKK